METTSRAGWFAVMLGILLPGLGHVYIRQFGKGFVLNILGWGATSLTFLMVRDTAIAPVNLVSLLSHIFSATAASEGLGNPVARAS